MSYARVGDLITQSGTDADLSGLNGVTGVTVSTKGLKTIYTIDYASAEMWITGTQDHDPDLEELVFRTDAITDGFVVKSGGLYRFGKETIIGGITRYSTGDGLTMPRDQNNQQLIGSLEIENGGQFEWRGGTIYSSDPMGCLSGGIATIYAGRYVATGQGTGQAPSSMFMRNDGLNTDVQVFSIELDALDPTTAAAIVFSRNGSSQMSFKALSAFVQTRTGSTTGALVFRGIEFANNAYFLDVELNGSATSYTNTQGLEIANVDVGTGIRTDNNLLEPGHLAIFQEVEVNILDAGDVPIENAKVYIPTVDSGNRIDLNLGGPFQNNRTFTGSTYDSYMEISDSSGDTPTINVLTGRILKDISDTGYIDLYSDSQTLGVDDFKIYYNSYNHQSAEAQLVLHSSSPIRADRKLLVDTSVTELDEAVVAAYTDLNDAPATKIYDAVKKYKIDNYPEQVDPFVAISGNIINAHDLDVVYDDTATPIVDLTGNTLTLKSDYYTDGIVTTGSVTAINGSDISLASISSSAGVNTKVIISGLTDSNVQILDDSGVEQIYLTAQTGSVNYATPIGASGSWKVIVDRVGYIATVNTFTADGEGKSFSGALIKLTQASGADMYTASSSPLLDVIPVADGSRLNIRVGDGTVTAQQIFDEVEMALATSDGMKYLANGGGRVEIASLPTGTFLFLKTNVRLIRDSASDDNATVEAFVTSSDGIVLDSVNGAVQFVTVTRAAQLAEYGGSIWIDTAIGIDSGSYPNGTQASPCRTLANVEELSAFYGIQSVKVSSTLIIDRDLANYYFEGDYGLLDLGGFNVGLCQFEEFSVYGSSTNTTANEILFKACRFVGAVSFCGTALNCPARAIMITLTDDSNFYDCWSEAQGAGQRPSLNPSTFNLNVRGWKGGFELQLANGGDISLGGSESNWVLNDNNISVNNMVLRGTGTIDNSSSLTFTSELTEIRTDTDIRQVATISEIDANEAKIDSIKAVTDSLPNSGALTDISTGVDNLETRVPDVISLANINTEVDIALVDYGANTVVPDNAGITANGVAIGALNNVSTAQVQSSCDAALTANATINNIDTGVDNIEAKLPTGTISDFDESSNQVIVATNNDKTNYSLANNSISSSVVANNAFNNSAFTTGYYNSINSQVDIALADYDGPTRTEATTDKDEIIAAFPSLSGLSTFDPVNDVVARVTLVDTTTVNSDMVAEAPTASEIDTELTSTHGAGSWITGSGGDDSATIWSYANRGLTEEVTTDLASRTASRATGFTVIGDLSDLATKDNQTVINDGVKNSSLIKPHKTNLPD